MSTRFFASSALIIAALGSSSIASAQPAEADAPAESDEEGRSRLIKPEGEGMDNEQLGGEPSLTEPEPKPAAQVEGETSAEECDLDCIEAELAAEEHEEREKEGTLELGKETGAIQEGVPQDIGGAAAAEPTTTTLDEVRAPPDRLPARLGPVRIRVGKTDDWIGIGFAAQLEFEDDEKFATAGFPKESNQFLEFRRIRFNLSSSFIDGRIRSRLQINWTPSLFDLLDMWFAFTRYRFATVRVGQFKIPFDRYRATSYAALSFVDWPPTTRMFGSERQVGVEMYARSLRKLEYAFGIFNGTNARGAHGVGIIEVYGERPTNPSKIGVGEKVTEFHPELTGRFAKNFGDIDTAFNSDVLGTKELRQSVGAGFSWDARPTATEDLPLRFSFEWLAKISGFDWNIVSYIAWYEPWVGGRIDFGPIGFMGELGYRFSRIWELAIRYSINYVTPSLRRDARSYGEFQIANATDPAAANAQYGRNGDQRTDSELALAGTSHIIGNSFRVVAQVAWRSQIWDTGTRQGLRTNLQLQLLF